MKTVVIACVFVSFCVFVQTNADQDYLACAQEKWGKMFVNVTFIQGSYDCVANTDYKASEVIDVLEEICNISYKVKNTKQFYTSMDESEDKYNKLYEYANNVMKEDNVLAMLVANKTDALRDCIAKELQKATNRITDAETCLPDKTKNQ